MSIEIRLVGGPAGGRTYAIPDASPPHRYRIPIAPSVTDLMAAASLEPSPTQVAEYEPLLEDRWPRRADDGAYLYQHRAAPMTPDERQALKEARNEDRAAKAKRDKELNEAWQAIREERPNYPEDRPWKI